MTNRSEELLGYLSATSPKGEREVYLRHEDQLWSVTYPQGLPAHYPFDTKTVMGLVRRGVLVRTYPGHEESFKLPEVKP